MKTSRGPWESSEEVITAYFGGQGRILGEVEGGERGEGGVDGKGRENKFQIQEMCT